MTYEAIALLFFAGIAGGAISAIAGGSSLVTFPVLMASGLPPIVANATNFVTVLPGNTGAALAYREQLSANRSMAVKLSIVSLLGGGVGCALLLQISNDVFAALVPWLLLTATFLLAFGKQINKALAGEQQTQSDTGDKSIGIAGLVMIFVFSVYGGFYGGGLGVVMLAGMTLLGFHAYHEANALKNLTNAVIGFLGVAIYAVSGLISWPHALALMAGSAIGGYGAVRIAQFLPQKILSMGMIVFGICVSVYYFWTL